jgi:signal transduction histidine kinase
VASTEHAGRRLGNRSRAARLAAVALIGTVLAVTAAAVMTARAWHQQRAAMVSALETQVVFAARQFGDALADELHGQTDASSSIGGTLPVTADAWPDSAELDTLSRTILARAPLLPPTFGNVPWPVTDSGSVGLLVTHEFDTLPLPSAAALHSLLALRVADCADVVRWSDSAYDAPSFAATPAHGEYSRRTAPCLSVDARLRVDAAARLVEQAVPGAGRALLVGLLALAAVFAVAAALLLRQQQRLVAAQEAFVSAVSHELRTPLTQIRMFSETLLLGRAKSPEQERRWLGVIQRESERLGTLVESILQFTRSERRAVPLAREVTDLAELARDVIQTFLPMAAARRVTLRTRLPSVALAFVDGGAVRQILLNLLDNAVKYGPRGQTVTVELGRGARGTIEFRVDDQGPGVAPTDRDRVWEPFARLHAGDGTVGGSGLGLNVVRSLAERHGGTTYVTEAPGGTGARFVLVLPVGLTASDADQAEVLRVTQEFAAAEAFPGANATPLEGTPAVAKPVPAAERPLHADAWLHAEVEELVWPPEERR